MIKIKNYGSNEDKQLATDYFTEGRNDLCLTFLSNFLRAHFFPGNYVDTIEVNKLKFWRHWRVNNVQNANNNRATIEAICSLLPRSAKKNQTHEYMLISSAQVRNSTAKMIVKPLLKNV